jgi:hypothetical protein
MRRIALIALPLAAACSSSAPPSTDVVGPYSGPVQRFTVDALTLPANAKSYPGVYFLGDGPRNQYGSVCNGLAQVGDLAPAQAVADMVAAGAIDLAVEIQSDDPMLADDPSVGVTLVSGATRSDSLGGWLSRGALSTNPIATTTHPVTVHLALPAFADADPLAVDLVAAELDLTPDGRGGFDGQLHGALRDLATAVAPEAWRAALQEIALHPEQHPFLVQLLDANRDGAITLDEFTQSTLVSELLFPDVALFDSSGAWAPRSVMKNGVTRDALSVGLALHLAPCASGRCASAVTDPCDDRVRDGNEADVDCGGSCGGCAGGAACTRAADCQSGSCTGGRCDAPSCSDGVKNDLETDVDCGGGLTLGGQCPRCATGRACQVAPDCAGPSATCINGVCG